ncbi:hypothetical protein VPH35_032376 [Triticum aestivum]
MENNLLHTASTAEFVPYIFYRAWFVLCVGRCIRSPVSLCRARRCILTSSNTTELLQVYYKQSVVIMWSVRCIYLCTKRLAVQFEPYVVGKQMVILSELY